MPRLSRFFALVLLAVWLPATQHCALEAAGIIATSCGDDGCAALDDQDGCLGLESATYKSNHDFLRIPPPTLRDCAIAIAIRPARVPVRSEPAEARATLERARDWVTVWHFVRRTAPPPRAPSVFCA